MPGIWLLGGFAEWILQYESTCVGVALEGFPESPVTSRCVMGVSAHSPTSWGPQELSGSSPKRRRAEDKDEGIGSPDIWEDEKAEDLRREMIELRQQLDKERSVRMMLEEQVRQRPLLAGVMPGRRVWIPFSRYSQECLLQALGRWMA